MELAVERLSVEEAYRRAEFQLPGIRIVVGPHAAREERTKPISRFDWCRVPGEASWEDHNLKRWLGHVPSLQTKWWAKFMSAVIGRSLMKDEWLDLERMPLKEYQEKMRILVDKLIESK